MGKSKKSFWKQMYLSNGWAIDRIIIPAGFIIFFFVVGFLTNIIFGIPESVKVDNGTSYYVNLIGWYFLSGFSVTALLVTFCLFIYYVPYAAVSKTLAISRYCKLPLSKEELFAAKNNNVFTDANSYFAYIRKQLEYCHGERSLSLSDEEIFKYFEIFKKTLSGTIGKNLLNLEFPLTTEAEGDEQEFLLRLKNSRLTDDSLVDECYDKIIEHYYNAENYFIILVHAAYDVPGKARDNTEMFDSSDEVYEYILCCICPVKLSKAGLCYNEAENRIRDRIRDWIVELPERGFLFPAFNDRSTDLHAMLYYSKKPEELQAEFVENMFGCEVSLTAGEQKESFQAVISDTLGEECNYETVKTIHDNLNMLMEEHKDDPEPVMLDKREVKQLLERSGVEDEKLSDFDTAYDNAVGEDTSLMASNLVNTRRFEIKTPLITIQVSPEYADLVETRIVDGKKCLVITVDDNVTVNGIPAKTMELDE